MQLGVEEVESKEFQRTQTVFQELADWLDKEVATIFGKTSTNWQHILTVSYWLLRPFIMKHERRDMYNDDREGNLNI